MSTIDISILPEKRRATFEKIQAYRKLHPNLTLGEVYKRTQTNGSQFHLARKQLGLGNASEDDLNNQVYTSTPAQAATSPSGLDSLPLGMRVNYEKITKWMNANPGRSKQAAYKATGGSHSAYYAALQRLGLTPTGKGRPMSTPSNAVGLEVLRPSEHSIFTRVEALRAKHPDKTVRNIFEMLDPVSPMSMSPVYYAARKKLNLPPLRFSQGAEHAPEGTAHSKVRKPYTRRASSAPMQTILLDDVMQSETEEPATKGSYFFVVPMNEAKNFLKELMGE